MNLPTFKGVTAEAARLLSMLPIAPSFQPQPLTLLKRLIYRYNFTLRRQFFSFCSLPLLCVSFIVLRVLSLPLPLSLFCFYSYPPPPRLALLLLPFLFSLHPCSHMCVAPCSHMCVPPCSHMCVAPCSHMYMAPVSLCG